MGRSWRIGINPNEKLTLVSTGPYRYVRHPIYSALILAVAGTLLALEPTLRGVALLFFLSTVLRLKSLLEEKLLIEHFPNEYPDYKRQVKALIPFLY